MLLWVQYHDNTSGGVVAVIAGGVCCYGCSTMLILLVALWRSVQCGYVFFGFSTMLILVVVK